MQMWTCFDSEYIRNFLEGVQNRGDQLTVWQNNSPTGERDKYTARVIKVEPQNVVIELDEGQGGTFSATDALYVHCNYRDLIFKRDRYKKDGRLISFKFPNEIKLKDIRRTPRLTYIYQDSKVIAFNAPHPTNPHAPKMRLSSILVDISTEGLGFVIPQREFSSFEVGMEIFLTRLTDQVLPNEHRGEILYIVPYYTEKVWGGERKTNLVKVGIRFVEPLESISYKSINSLVTKKQTRIHGLNVNTFNGLTEDEQERVLIKIAENNHVMANRIREFIEKIDRLRYLTPKMKQEFLMEVNKDIFATSLKLSSKELIYDLLIEVTDNIRDEFLHRLDQQKSINAVRNAQEEICKFITEKEKSGELILDPVAFEQYV